MSHFRNHSSYIFLLQSLVNIHYPLASHLKNRETNKNLEKLKNNILEYNIGDSMVLTNFHDVAVPKNIRSGEKNRLGGNFKNMKL